MFLHIKDFPDLKLWIVTTQCRSEASKQPIKVQDLGFEGGKKFLFRTLNYDAV
jgi:hypothetical protein